MTQQIYDGKILMIPPQTLIHKLRANVNSWNTAQKGSFTIFFGTARQKIDRRLWRKTLYHKRFRYPKLVQQGRVSVGICLELWDKKKFERKMWYSLLPHLSINFFDTRIFVKRRVFTHESFRCSETKILPKNCDISILSRKFFDTRN